MGIRKVFLLCLLVLFTGALVFGSVGYAVASDSQPDMEDSINGDLDSRPDGDDFSPDPGDCFSGYDDSGPRECDSGDSDPDGDIEPSGVSRAVYPGLWDRPRVYKSRLCYCVREGQKMIEEKIQEIKRLTGLEAGLIKKSAMVIAAEYEKPLEEVLDHIVRGIPHVEGLPRGDS